MTTEEEGGADAWRWIGADKIIREAGLGTFGRVLECLDKQRNIIVAIKVVRQVDKYSESAKVRLCV